MVCGDQSTADSRAKRASTSFAFFNKGGKRGQRGSCLRSLADRNGTRNGLTDMGSKRAAKSEASWWPSAGLEASIEKRHAHKGKEKSPARANQTSRGPLCLFVAFPPTKKGKGVKARVNLGVNGFNRVSSNGPHTAASTQSINACLTYMQTRSRLLSSSLCRVRGRRLTPFPGRRAQKASPLQLPS